MAWRIQRSRTCAIREIELLFMGLPKGKYRLRTIHHGPSSDTDAMDPLHGKEHTADISKLPPAICLDVVVNDANSGNQVLAAFVPQDKGRSVAKGGPSTAEFEVHSDGINPIVVHIRATDGKGSVWLNGIDLWQRVH